MATPVRGEVWLVDLGMVAKVRPCLVLSIPVLDTDRDLVTVVGHTTSTRRSRFEVSCNPGFLKVGAFDVQNVVTIPRPKVIRRLGKLATDDMLAVESALRSWLGLDENT